MRLAVYTGYAYSRRGGRLYAQRAFALFLARLAPQLERLVLVGGLRPLGQETHYLIPAEVDFVALPYHESLARPSALGGGALRRFWHALDDVDTVWLFAPHPLAILFALLAAVRRRRVALGVRQDNVAYVRSRHPDRPDLHLAAWLLDRCFRLMARRFPVVVVGPELARSYRGASQLLEIAVSLVGEDDVIAPETGLSRSYDGEVRILSVGRLDAEKNPLLLADVLALLNADGPPRHRLIVCGEGPMAEALGSRLADLGQADHAELAGYVPYGPELFSLYRDSHVLLHTSWTEGLPQVLLEGFAAALPVVAADVGGIREAVGHAVSLVPPGEPEAAAAAVRAVISDAALRERLVRRGTEYVRTRTAEVEVARVARLLRDGSGELSSRRSRRRS